MRIRVGSMWRAGRGVLLHHLAGRNAPLFASIALTNRCNLSCDYCGCHKRRLPELSTAQVRDVIDGLRDLGTVKIGFTGGEPMLRDDLYDLIAHARRAGMITHVVTNGSLLNASTIARMSELDLLLVSLEGSPEVQRLLRKGSRGDEPERIRMAIDAGIPVIVVTTLVRQNLAVVPFLLEQSRALGAGIQFSLLHENECAADDLSGLVPDHEELGRTLDVIAAFKRQGGHVTNSYASLEFARHWPNVTGPRCYAGKLYVVIDTNGDVYPCWPGIGLMRPGNVLKDGVAKAVRLATTTFDCKGCNFSCHQDLNLMLSLRPDAIRSVLGL